MTDVTAWKEMAACRANTYQFLVSAFLEPPTKESVERLTDGGVAAALGDLFGEDVSRDLGKAASDVPGRLAEMREDFMALFMVPLEAYVAPYEAVYRDERDAGGKKVKGLLMGPSTRAVKAMYRRAGAALDPTEFKELPDHISAELGFMHHLCGRELEVLSAAGGGETDATTECERRGREILELEKEFLDEHLARWAYRLSDNIKKNARTPLYRGIGSLLASFLRSDAAYLTEMCRASP